MGIVRSWMEYGQEKKKAREVAQETDEIWARSKKVRESCPKEAINQAKEANSGHKMGKRRRKQEKLPRKRMK